MSEEIQNQEEIDRCTRIYEIGVSTMYAVERGDESSVKRLIAEARKLGVEIEDDAFDNLIRRYREGS